MEAKFLASVFSFLSIFLAIYAQSLVNDDKDSTEFEYETAIYYGDSDVNLGEPFSITCIIPINTKINWIKNGEPITRHNLRHGRDEHSYTLSESEIEGERNKIEAHISVRHALKVHEGKYHCNGMHGSYHMLHVRNSPGMVSKPQTNSPFIILENDNRFSTETAYKTIDLTPSSGNGADSEDLFTRIWEPLPARPAVPLPTATPTITTHHRQHHHHHLQQQQFLQKEAKDREQHKLIYINATSFDGSPPVAAGSHEQSGLLNLEYMPPTPKGNELTTVPWRASSGITPNVHLKHATPPHFPPPRTAMWSTTMSPPGLVQHHTPMQHADYHHYHTNTKNAVTNDRRDYEPQQVPPAHFPLQTIQPTSYYQPTHQSGGFIYYPAPQSASTPYNPYQQTLPTQQYAPQQRLPSMAGGGGAFITPAAASPYAPTLTTFVGSAARPQPHAIRPVSKEPEFLVPNYDNVEHQLKVFEIRSPLVLSCNITKDGDYALSWEKNGTDVTKVKELEGRFRIIAPERKFIIDRTDIHDDGLYSCVANNQRRDINVVARVVVRVPSNTGVVEGEKLSIVCIVVGTDPQLSWAIGNLTISNSTGRYVLKPDDNQVENAVFSMENVSLDDRGEFKCIARNAANQYANYAEASDVSYVRVKGKLAALWPFLGICAEVLILCTIILIYEKRRNKTELEESDTDPQEQKKKRRNYD